MSNALLDDLRAIVAGPDREHLRQLEARIRELERRTGDDEALVAAVSPILGDAIRRQVREDRAEMVESLYPIIGQLIARAVAEAIRDLARNIDRRMRSSFSPAYFLRRLRARARGVSDADLALRDALPFQVAELFLVHRESGLLLLHLSREHPDPSTVEDNSDLVSSMLTAIRDFAQDAFGQDQQGGLDEIQYGNRRILIEACQHVYLAVVVDGVEPAGFRAQLRERGIEVENAYLEALKDYDGDASQFAPAQRDLAVLLAEGEFEPGGLSPSQKRVAVGLAVALTLCLGGACLGSVTLAARALSRPAYVVVVTATPGPTATPTNTATFAPTNTATFAPTSTPAQSPTATATQASATQAPATQTPLQATGRAIVVANVRAAPNLDAPVLERAAVGKTYTISGRDATGGWLQVCCTARGDAGWLAAALVTITGSIDDVPIVAGE